VGDLVRQMISKTGENIKVRRFTRYKMGEGLEKRTSDLGAAVKDWRGGASSYQKASRKRVFFVVNLKPLSNNLSDMSETPVYKRILLKLSGEALMGDRGYGIDPVIITRIAQEINHVHSLGVEVAVVVGAGNIFRGLAASADGMDRASADYMGMLATVMNAVALQDAVEEA